MPGISSFDPPETVYPCLKDSLEKDLATVYSSSVNRRGELSAGKLASTVWREANEPKEGLAADPTL